MSVMALTALATAVLAVAATAVSMNHSPTDNTASMLFHHLLSGALLIIGLTVVPSFVLTGLLQASGEVLLTTQAGVIAAYYFVLTA